MNPVEGLLYGLELALTPELLLAALAAALIGTLVGTLPGIGPVAGAALMLPLTLQYSPAVSLIMIAGIYLGCQYGGSTSSILLNIPGEGYAVVATFDGYPMTQKGRAGQALAIVAIGAFVAGIIALTMVTTMAPVLSRFALNFGPAEYFALTAGGLLALARISGGSLADGLFPMIIGVALGTVGLEEATAASRFTFGNLDLALGMSLPAVAIGLYGISELLFVIEGASQRRAQRVRFRDLMPSREEWRRALVPWVRGSFVGFGFGLLPVPSATLSTFASYRLEKSVSKHRKQFGKGAVEGLAGPEAANNAAALSSLVPVLVLGIPFSATLALMLSAMMVQGIQPGPLMMVQHPEVFWSVIAAVFVANIAMLVLNLPMIGAWVRVLQTPQYLLAPMVILIGFIGVFGLHNNMLDLRVALIFGVVGYLLRKLGFSLASLLVGFILGGMIEKYLREGLFISSGDPMYFVTSPIAAGIWIIVTLLVVLTGVFQFGRRRAARVAEAKQEVPSESG